MEDKIILERHKKSDYSVWHDAKRYFWAGSKGNIVSKVNVPREVYDYLAMSTDCFKDGELILGTNLNPELKEELKEEIFEKEETDANSLTKEDIEKFLKGTIPAMKAELDKITSDSTKQFVLDVAKELKINNASKQKMIKEWYGFGEEISIEEIFDAE